MSADERAVCAGTARWLYACAAALGSIGLIAALAALLLLVMRQPLPQLATLALLLVLAERVFALRLRFDAGLFSDLARGPGSLPAVDRSLQALRLRNADATLRPLPDRIEGARRLVLRHALVALLQFTAVSAQALMVGFGVVR